MTILEAVVLGLVQGLTEFLPVSSSGHLLLAEDLMGVNPPGVLLEVAVHVATLGSVLLYFRQDIVRVTRHTLFGGADRRLGLAVVVGTLPAVVVGLGFKDALEAALETPAVAAACLVVTGLALLVSRWAPGPVSGGDGTVGPLRGLWIGCAQAVAILPGISRSGSTIIAALFLGVEPARAARFSFLLAIPAILGAGILHARDLHGVEEDLVVPILAACVAAFASGLAAVHVLFTMVCRGKLAWFGPYCLLVGAAWGVMLLTR